MPRRRVRLATHWSRSTMAAPAAAALATPRRLVMAAMASTPWRPTTRATRRRPRPARRPRRCSTRTAPSSTASSPALTNQTSFNVSYTATAGSAGLAQVALYAQAPGQTGYTKVATNSSGSGSGSFSYTATAGDGSYGFYTVATDNAGNAQATPAGAQATTLLDTTAPSSTASSPAADQPDELQRLLHGG